MHLRSPHLEVNVFFEWVFVWMPEIRSVVQTSLRDFHACKAVANKFLNWSREVVGDIKCGKLVTVQFEPISGRSFEARNSV